VTAKADARFQKAELSAERVLEELRRIAFLDPREFYFPPGHKRAGQLKSVHEMSAEVSACISTQKIARANLDKTDGKRNEEWLHELKHWDNSALRWATSACIRERRLVDQNSVCWNPIVKWLRQLESLERPS
jgi:hypothetical protein